MFFIIGANDSVRQLLAFDSPAAEVVPLRRPKRQPKIANAPFANDTNNGDKDSVKKRDLERQLMHLHVEKEQVGKLSPNFVVFLTLIARSRICKTRSRRWGSNDSRTKKKMLG